LVLEILDWQILGSARLKCILHVDVSLGFTT
jgi:hypothetical protein